MAEKSGSELASGSCAVEPAALEKWNRYQRHWSADHCGSRADAFVHLQWDETCGGLAAMLRRLRTQHGGAKPVLLDVGCGTGAFYAYLSGFGFEYWGVEPSQRQLEKLPVELRDRVVRGTAEEVPFADGAADFIVLKSVLDQCYAPDKVVEEAARLLRPGGVVFCSLPNRASWYKRLFPRQAATAQANDIDHLHFFTIASARALFHHHQFAICEVRCFSYLRLPRRITTFIMNRFGERASRQLIRWSDAVGRLIVPRGGAVFALVAVRDPHIS